MFSRFFRDSVETWENFAASHDQHKERLPFILYCATLTKHLQSIFTYFSCPSDHQYQCKNLKREEVKQWLHDMLKLLNQKSDQNLEAEKKRLEALHQRHVEMLPGIEENMRKVSVGKWSRGRTMLLQW